MNEAIVFIISFISGLLLGWVFFAGLWITLKDIGHARHPVLRIFGSLLLRMGLVLAGFYALIQWAGWPHLLVATLGFTLLRLALAQRLRQPGAISTRKKRSQQHDHQS